MSDSLELELIIKALVEGLSDLKGLGNGINDLFGKTGKLSTAFEQLNKNMAAGFAITAKASHDSANRIIADNNRIADSARKTADEQRKAAQVAAQAAREQAQTQRDLQAVLGAAGGGMLGGILGASGISPGAGAAVLGIEVLKKALSALADIAEVSARTTVSALMSIAETGIDVNARIEQFVIAGGATVQKNMNVDLKTGMAAVSEQMNKLQFDALQTNATFVELGQVFTTALPALTNYGIGLDQARQITVSTTTAAGLFGVSVKEAGNFLVQALNGNLRITNPLMQRFATDMKEVQKEWKAGKLTGEQFGNEILRITKAYKDAGGEIQKSMVGIKSNFEDLLQISSSQVTFGLFEDLKKSGTELLNFFTDIAGKTRTWTPDFQAIVNIFKEFYGVVGDVILVITDKLLVILKEIGAEFSNNKTNIEGSTEGFKNLLLAGVDLAANLLEIVGTLIHIQLGSKQSGDAFNTLADVVKGINTFILLLAEASFRVAEGFYAAANAATLGMVPALRDMGNEAKAAADKMAGLRTEKEKTFGSSKIPGGLAGIPGQYDPINSPTPTDKKFGGGDGAAKAKKDFDERLAIFEAFLKAEDDQEKQFSELSKARIAAGKETWVQYYTELAEMRKKNLTEQISELSALLDKGEKAGLSGKTLAPIASQLSKLQGELDNVDLILDAEKEKMKLKGEELVAKLNEGIAKGAGGPQAKEALKLFELELRKQFQGQEMTPEIEAKIRLAVDQQQANLAFADLETQFKQVMARLQASIAGINASVSAGTMSPNAGAKAIGAAQGEAAGALQPIINGLEQIKDKVPGAVAALGQIGAEQTKLTASSKAAANQMTAMFNQVGQMIGSGLLNAFGAVIDGTKSVKQAFADMAKDMLKQLAMLIIKTLLLKAIGGMGGAGGTGIMGGIFSALGGTATAAHAAGGMITGPGTGTSDSILARVSNGEYIIKADAVRKRGVAFLDWVNNPKFAEGGLVTRDGWSPAAQSGMPDMNFAIGITDKRETTEEFLRSSKGQRLHVEITDKNSVTIGRIINR